MKPSAGLFLVRISSRRIGVHVRRASRGPGDRGHAQGVGAPSYLLASSKIPWLVLQDSRIMFVPKITLPKVSFRLDSV